MHITFLGTRGYIDARTSKHYYHTATLITYRNKKIMVDCGEDWVKKVWQIKPDAIVLTHAHPDHAYGLKNGSPCPVYATTTTWQLIKDFLIPEDFRKKIFFTKPNIIYGVNFKPIKVLHSLKAPAVSFRISIDKKTFFYSGDIAYLPDQKRNLKNVSLYIGDGSTVQKTLISKKYGQIHGHASVKTQLGWCKKAGIKNAIFTHCGTELVTKFQDNKKYIQKLVLVKKLSANIACDGLSVKIDAEGSLLWK